jgi:hypothetical protein
VLLYGGHVYTHTHSHTRIYAYILVINVFGENIKQIKGTDGDSMKEV